MTSPSSYRLIYFNGCGRGELIRWIFAFGNIRYTDDRIKLSEWRDRREGIYGGRLPLLMVDERPLTQSLAQARFMAKEAGLIPKDNLQAAYCDALVDSIEEIFVKYFPLLRFQGSEEEVAKVFRNLHTETITPFLTRLNEKIGDKPWFAGDQVSWGDLAIGNAANQFKMRMPYLLDAAPSVDQHVRKVEDLPGIKEWLKNRPKSIF